MNGAMNGTPDAKALSDSTSHPTSDQTRAQLPVDRRILITGASGALGGALARHMATPGTRLLLWGRAASRLSAIATECRAAGRSEEHTSELQSLMRISYAVFCLKKKQKYRN